MATRQVLAALSRDYQSATGQPVQVESVGGVDAAQRVAAGEAFDVVFLASDAIARLVASGHALAGTETPLVRSAVAMALRAGDPVPDISTEASVRSALLAARRISCSTGPSGTALTRLFEAWGVADELLPKMVVPPPGVPVGSLVASGQVDIGFQQYSELMHLPGLQVLQPLPGALQIVTTFTGAVCASSSQPEAARSWLAYTASAATTDTKQRCGMDAG
jgi:molybdate transport system substrate-binding protein